MKHRVWIFLALLIGAALILGPLGLATATRQERLPNWSVQGSAQAGAYNLHTLDEPVWGQAVGAMYRLTLPLPPQAAPACCCTFVPCVRRR